MARRRTVVNKPTTMVWGFTMPKGFDIDLFKDANPRVKVKLISAGGLTYVQCTLAPTKKKKRSPA